MTRKDKQARLQSINKAICAITATYDMGVQIDYISGKGAQESMGSFGQWPCLEMHITDTLRQIQRRLIDGETIGDGEMMADFVCSEICTMHDLFSGEEGTVGGDYLKSCLDLIRNRLTSVDLSGDMLYAYVALEEWHTQIELFSSYDSLFDFFIRLWDSGVETYEEMGDDDIDFWYQIAEDSNWDEEMTLMAINNENNGEVYE